VGTQIAGMASRKGRNLARSASCSIASASSTRRRAARSISRPSGVSATVREDLLNSRAPKCFSSAATRRLATDCGIRAAEAPTVKLL
jgi:hypothetical protein